MRSYLSKSSLTKSYLYSTSSILMAFLSILLWYKGMSITTDVPYKPYIEVSIVLYVAHIFCFLKAVKVKENKVLLLINLIIYNLLLVLIITYAFMISFKY
ncbi:hypothetical protein EDC24_1356 [Aquisalibacillus elongatus]|uniref:Uncharacterized protein n=1 Tax=Aquisalibacillus elongatus TaxID=485577 RepID=A0A3N5B9L2_9BACI|nr:hypothetical protein EDC24_1356 [Aquisalibacillus elongatus]